MIAQADVTVRCAIYTRKSTDEGLELDFNSLDAQRESAEAYIASMKHEGWVCLPDRYDDGGFTGGNMDRPAVKRLLTDIESGKIDCVVVYKVGAAHWFNPDINNATDLWNVKKVSPQAMVHLTEKPVELALRAMNYSSRPGESVLDLFGGSGSTLIAAERLGRRAFLMEIDPLYCDVIVQRWEAFTGKKAEVRSA